MRDEIQSLRFSLRPGRADVAAAGRRRACRGRRRPRRAAACAGATPRRRGSLSLYSARAGRESPRGGRIARHAARAPYSASMRPRFSGTLRLVDRARLTERRRAARQPCRHRRGGRTTGGSPPPAPHAELQLPLTPGGSHVPLGCCRHAGKKTRRRSSAARAVRGDPRPSKAFAPGAAPESPDPRRPSRLRTTRRPRRSRRRTRALRLHRAQHGERRLELRPPRPSNWCTSDVRSRAHAARARRLEAPDPRTPARPGRRGRRRGTLGAADALVVLVRREGTRSAQSQVGVRLARRGPRARPHGVVQPLREQRRRARGPGIEPLQLVRAPGQRSTVSSVESNTANGTAKCAVRTRAVRDGDLVPHAHQWRGGGGGGGGGGGRASKVSFGAAALGQMVKRVQERQHERRGDLLFRFLFGNVQVFRRGGYGGCGARLRIDTNVSGKSPRNPRDRTVSRPHSISAYVRDAHQRRRWRRTRHRACARAPGALRLGARLVFGSVRATRCSSVQQLSRSYDAGRCARYGDERDPLGRASIVGQDGATQPTPAPPPMPFSWNVRVSAPSSSARAAPSPAGGSMSAATRGVGDERGKRVGRARGDGGARFAGHRTRWAPSRVPSDSAACSPVLGIDRSGSGSSAAPRGTHGEEDVSPRGAAARGRDDGLEDRGRPLGVDDWKKTQNVLERPPLPTTSARRFEKRSGDASGPRRTCRDRAAGGDATPATGVVVGDPPADVPDADAGGLDPLGVDPLVIRRVAAPRQRAHGEGTRAQGACPPSARRGNNPRRVRASSRAACPRRGACARGHRRGPGRETRRRAHVSRRSAPSYVGMRFSHIPSFFVFR